MSGSRDRSPAARDLESSRNKICLGAFDEKAEECRQGSSKTCQSSRLNLLSLWKPRDLRLRKMFFRKVGGGVARWEVLSTREAQQTAKNVL